MDRFFQILNYKRTKRIVIMRRISYGRIFVGGVVVNVVLTFLWLILYILISLMDSSVFEGIEEYIGLIFFVYIFIVSPIGGLLCMLVLALFGKDIEDDSSTGKTPKKKIIYVVKEREEDRSRYMPH